MALATAAVAGGAALATYLDGKFHLRKDFDTIRRLRQGPQRYAQGLKEDKLSIWYLFEAAVKKNPSSTAVWSRAGCYTFQELYDQAARYAQWLLVQGVKPGQLVAVYLQNCPEFIVLLFALAAIGSAPAAINWNLEDKALLHCLDVCEASLILVDEEAGCQQRIGASREALNKRGMRSVTLGEKLKQEISVTPAVVPPEHYRAGMNGDWPAMLIYTSGTTGLPKGCAFTTGRVWQLGSYDEPAFGGVPGVDCWYNAMPLYHGTGGITSLTALLSGVSVAIARKFSVSRFWDDIHDSGATFFIYVGETARYLLNAPPHKYERNHKVRCAYGNGLRPDIWKKFQDRFNIPEVAEFFNSTEGMFSLVVWDKGDFLRGVVGHHGLLLRYMLRNTYIPVQIDHETGEIWRDPKTGFAKRVPYEEGGEMIVAVPNKQAFQGYWRSPAATEKKFCTDLFKKGDVFYRSGDALRRMPDGRWLFMDRLGDTFRWKSENVSTAEVAECLGRYPGVAEANVYGVLVPNHEGRAGCAALHIESAAESNFNYDDMLKYVQARLPRYAVPIFLRVVKASTHIHNHKQNKVPLRKEGVDPKLIGTEAPEGKDDVFMWLPPKSAGYVRFKQEDWDRLAHGQARL